LAPEPPNTTGSGTVLAWAGVRTIGNPIQYPTATNNQTLIIGGSNNLTFSGPISLNGNDGTGSVNRTFQVTSTALTTFLGAVTDGGLNCGLTKTGVGVLALDAAETYAGPTAVNAGTLLVNNQLAAGAVTVATNGVLGGTGSIGGAVTVQAGGALSPGDSIGTLTINNNLTLSGNLLIEVNKSASPTSDKVVVSGVLTNAGAGTVTVTNLGPALAQNDTFTLFSQPVLNGGALRITGGGSSVTWTNKLAIDGTIAVLSVVPTTPTNITFSVSGGSILLSWPANYIGWTLEGQTNAPGIGITTNWFRIPNSSTVNQVSIPIGPANGTVFFRLVYP
jgi:autotransporter-associated beta strand protein